MITKKEYDHILGAMIAILGEITYGKKEPDGSTNSSAVFRIADKYWSKIESNVGEMRITQSRPKVPESELGENNLD